MNDYDTNIDSKSGTNAFGQIVARLLTSAIILGITAFFTPGFSINNLWSLALAAVVLTAIDYLIIRVTGIHASTFGRGIVGFAVAAVILYVTQFFVAGYTISWMAAIIGALIYGIVDYFIPGTGM